MCSKDLRWRIVSLINVCDMDASFIRELFGPKPLRIQSRYRRFLKAGSAHEDPTVLRKSWWPDKVVQNFEACVKAHPTFCIEELQDYLRAQHPNLRNTSEAKIYRALNFDLRITKKNLMKSAREDAPEEIQNYCDKLRAISSFLHPLIFLTKQWKMSGERSRDTTTQRTALNLYLESLSVAEIDFLFFLLSTETDSCRGLALKEPTRAKIFTIL